MAAPQVAFLGPLGTYSHLVAEKRFGRGHRLVPLPTILDVCAFVARRAARLGVIPIENSSGGAIYETVDILLANEPPVHVCEEIALDVQLALIGRKGMPTDTLYTHFAPLEHCATWIRRHLAKVRRQVVSSTAVAAIHAASQPGGVALGNRRLARIYNLDILHYPVQSDIPNVTTFLVVAGRRAARARASKTTLAVTLPNVPGSLCDFLGTFRAEQVNLSRLISRPLRGRPKEYAFLVDIEGGTAEPAVRAALAAAARTCTALRIVGSYPSGRTYTS